MKKVIILTLCMAILFIPCMAFADSEQAIPVYINGARVELEIQPEMMNGVCMVPLSELSRKTHVLGTRVFMDPSEWRYIGILSYGGISTSVEDGKYEAFNSRFGPVMLNAAPYMNREDIMVPLTLFNVLADQGVYVRYDWNDQRIEITTANMLGWSFY